METTDLAAVGGGVGVYEIEGRDEIFRRTFGTEEESCIFVYLRLLKYIYQYIKHLDISYPSEVFATLDSYVIFSIT